MNVVQLLKSHQIRNTPIRKQVLTLFTKSKIAISTQDIEKHIEIDRITLYRTLNKFLNHGLIHRIDTKSGTHYALCNGCEINNHQDNHIHFKCISCQKIECFDQEEPFIFHLPKNYTGKKVNILIEGECAECK